MSTTPATVHIPAALVTYGRAFARFAGARLWLAVGLLIVIGLLEGSGLIMLVPLLHSLGLGSVGQLGGFVGSAMSSLGNIGAVQKLPSVLAAFVAIKALQASMRAVSANLNLKLEIGFVCQLRERFYRAMIEAEWLVLTRQRASDLSQALLGEFPMVGVGTRQLLQLLSLLIVAFVQILVALTLSPAMTALALGAGTVVGLGLRRFRRRSFVLGQLGQGKRAEMAAAVSEHLAGLKIAKSHGREEHHFTHFQRAMHAIAAHTLRMHRLDSFTQIWTEVGAVGALALFVWLAVDVRHVGTAPLLVLVFVFTRLLSHVTTLQGLWHNITECLPSFLVTEELREKLVRAAEPEPAAVPQLLMLRDRLTVSHVSFRYDPALPAAALQDVDLLIPARQVTAFCGSSGAGKSTLADLLLGLLSPTHGQILIDGAPLAGPRLHDWRQSIGYVPQETFLFHDTVRANLAWARPEATEAELRDALRAAAADTFVDRLPQGLDTIVGDRGVRLSGGERQRLALARALLRRPTLLVLDEATSSLDAHNERLVQDAIERLHGELTIVVIAHRLSTVRFADRIVMLDTGRIIETGTWTELNAREHGAFRRLVLASAT